MRHNSLLMERAAGELLIAARDRTRGYELHLPRHADLQVSLSTDTAWFYLRTHTGEPAAWDVLWLERQLGEPTVEDPQDYDEVQRYECGTLPQLRGGIAKVLTDPVRAPGSAVYVQISEWAMHYLGTGD